METMQRPKKENDKSSGAPIVSITGRKIGMLTANNIAPIIPPIIEAE
jgi:hypothetical protein